MHQAAEKKIEDFFSQLQLKVYQKGEIIISPGDALDNIYYLKKGLIKRYMINQDGKEFLLVAYKPKSYFPLSLIVNEKENKYYFEAITKSIVHISPKDKFVEFVKKEKDILFYTIRRFSRALYGLSLRIESLLLEDAYFKVATIINYVASTWGEKKGKNILVAIKQKEIANATGLTRETVSRQIAIMRKKGLLSYSKQTLVIKDFEKLKEEATQKK